MNLLSENTFEHLDDSGADRKDALVALNNLALVFAEAGQVDQAIPLYQQTLKLMQEKLGPGDPRRSPACTTWRWHSKFPGDSRRRFRCLKKPCGSERQHFGPESDIAVRTMTCVGATYGTAGNQEKCVELFGEVLRIRKAKLRDEHPETLWAMWQYGITLLLAGRDKEALPLFEKALHMSQVNPGIDHPTTLGLMPIWRKPTGQMADSTRRFRYLRNCSNCGERYEGRNIQQRLPRCGI